MFHGFGLFLSRWWFLVIAMWVAALISLRSVAPPFDDLAKEGEFVFLPESMPSRQGEALLERAFPGRQSSSSMVIVAYRDDLGGLTDDDHAFIDEKLKPALENVRDRVNPATPESTEKGDSQSTEKDDDKTPAGQKPIITDIRTFSTPGIGSLLESEDHQASLVTIDLSTDYRDTRNWKPVQGVADALGDFKNGNQIPRGLGLALTGSATLGRDFSHAEADSAQNTVTWTIGIVILLLVVIYRAPLLALVPLLTLFIAVDVSLHALTLLAQAGYVPLFKGLKEYTTVITYGPGIDYCLFLIARYKEDLTDCMAPRQALAQAIGQVGPAIAASGATVICGVGMLTFAQFGKFHEAGISISLALLMTLIATLTLTPSLLFMTGHWAFWPKPGIRYVENSENVVAMEGTAVQKNLFQPMWTSIGGSIERRPMLLLLGTLAVMLPFVLFAIAIYDDVNYGLLETLPKSATSAAGARVLEKHFPAGVTGPVQVLLEDPTTDFREEDGIAMVHDLVEKLMKRSDELKLADIRSVSDPLGTSPRAQEALSEASTMKGLVGRKMAHNRSLEHFVTGVPELDGHITELEFVLKTNPFSMESVRNLDGLTRAIHDELTAAHDAGSSTPSNRTASALIAFSLPAGQAGKTSISVVGPTASVRDVSVVSHGDQQRIYVLVVACVFVILIALLRTFSISLYLIATVLLSYLCTLGVTWLTFFSLDRAGFPGLDWTVPLFLFVVLIAVGEDYNIFLVSRIWEEQRSNGKKHGITLALSHTGGIITSCGFIMAGTFATLGTGSLARMQQLGFALALGVLLDTFVIRPILVPAFLMVLNEDRYGNLARYLK